MKETRFRRQFDEDYQGTYYDNDPGESMTVPDLTLTVRQLMENHTRGIGNDYGRQVVYTDDEVIPPIDDLVEVQERREELERRKKELDLQLQEEVRKAEKLKQEKLKKEKQKKDEEISMEEAAD